MGSHAATTGTIDTRPPRKKSFSELLLSKVIFSSRWLQAPLYLGLIVAQGVYVYHFLVELLHLLQDLEHTSESEIMLIVLGLIDVVMISNLLVMVIIGGYETFVSKIHVNDDRDIPEWLAHVNANTMKIKLALALIGISSIHLLKTFINAEHITDRVVYIQLGIHGMFLVSALLMAYTAKVTQSISDREHAC